VIDVIDRVPGLGSRAAHVRQHMIDERLRHRQYTRDHGEDAPDVRDWVWPGAPGSRTAPPPTVGDDTSSDNPG